MTCENCPVLEQRIQELEAELRSRDEQSKVLVFGLKRLAKRVDDELQKLGEVTDG